MARDVFGAAGRVLRAMAEGEPALVSRETLKARLGACLLCPHFQPATNLSWPRCGLCGCFVKLAARLATKDCPDAPGRWPTPNSTAREPPPAE